ncbi:hypothetical protein ACIA5D_38680 [Actinoplanes sp. NPDC051513]|uniref:hypothetical protein n=1 Tax=Actinoplanes sp. NPDC051513 TaxID=3363908 RepID=UPI0037B301E1
MAEVSLGDGLPVSLGYGESLGSPDGDAGPGVLGAVGVGTGGPSQLHSGFVGLVVRIGLAFLPSVAGGPAGGGAVGAGVVPATVVAPGAGRRTAAAPGPWPIPAFGVNVDVAAGGGGKVSAAAGVSFSSEPSPFTTAR